MATTSSDGLADPSTGSKPRPIRVSVLSTALVLVALVLFRLRKRLHKLHKQYKEEWKDSMMAIKALVGFTQINLALKTMMSGFDFKFPPMYVEFLKRATWFELNLLELIGVQCIVNVDYRYKVLIGLCIPVAIFLVCVLAFLFFRHRMRRRLVELTKEQRTDILHQLFDLIDFDMSGELDLEEVKFLIESMSTGKRRLSHEQVRYMMMKAGGVGVNDKRGPAATRKAAVGRQSVSTHDREHGEQEEQRSRGRDSMWDVAWDNAAGLGFNCCKMFFLFALDPSYIKYYDI